MYCLRMNFGGHMYLCVAPLCCYPNTEGDFRCFQGNKWLCVSLCGFLKWYGNGRHGIYVVCMGVWVEICAASSSALLLLKRGSDCFYCVIWGSVSVCAFPWLL